MIGLMDCNNFFVSCERLFRPDLLRKPVAVLSSNDGCIVARSQEVKDLGVPMGVPYFQVKEVLTKAGATLFSSNFTLYRDISARVMKTLESEVGFIDVYSVDEAFFELPDDTTEEEIAALRARIIAQVGIPVSIGVAETKTLAKQASVLAKKNNGVCILTSDLWKEKMDTVLCGSVWGVGRQTTVKLRAMGVETVAQYIALPLPILRQYFGVVGERTQKELQGVSVYAVGEGAREESQQSIMSTRSFEKTTTNLHDLESAIGYHVTEVAEKLREKKVSAVRMSVMILPSRHGDFFLHRGSAEVVFSPPTNATQKLLSEALLQLSTIYEKDVPYKKAGVVVSALVPEDYSTGTLFAEQKVDTKKIDVLTDMLNDKFGHGTVRSGVILKNGARGSAKLRSKEYTTRWGDIPTVQAK
jgi:DNA polymerase V